jgi:RecB family exonuclease
MESLSVHAGYQDLRAWVAGVEPDRWQALEQATNLLNLRQARASGSPYEGELRNLISQLDQHLGPARPWSASRLEAYRSCPFMFFIGSLLKLEPRLEPVEGLDARQLGNIYHRLFEQTFKLAADPTELDQLLAVLPEIAEQILGEAPEQEGFRETAWWAQTRLAIIESVQRSLVELVAQSGDFRPLAYEQGFFGDRAVTIGEGETAFRVHGIIDRIDQAPDGTIRIIDYKTSAPNRFNDKSVQEGKKLQLPLYALAARDALKLGQPVDGFYWHVRHGQASKFTLGTFQTEAGDTGPEAAFNTVIELAQEAVNGARAGHFTPKPPSDGCPTYCPAATFCWHYQPGFG